MTPPRDSPRKGNGKRDGGRKGSPERFDEDEEDLMVYDDDTRLMELLMEAVSYMSHGKIDLARAEADPVFKLLRFNGDAEQMDAEWCFWTSGMLTPLELHEIVKSYEVPLEEVEEWTNDLRIWFHQVNLEEGSDAKRDKKRSLERESSKDTPAEKVVPETSEIGVNVDEEVKKTKKKRKTTATDDPYTLLVPKPKKRPVNTEKGGSSSKAVILEEEKPSSCTRRKTAVSSKTQKKEKGQSPRKKEVAKVKGPETKDRSSDVDAQASTTVDAELEQSCKAIEDAKREGLISSIQRCVLDPVLTVSDLEHVLLRLHLSIDANRGKKK